MVVEFAVVIKGRVIEIIEARVPGGFRVAAVIIGDIAAGEEVVGEGVVGWDWAFLWGGTVVRVEL